MSKVGFIGLGIMGAPMAGHLIAAGHELSLHTRRRVPEALAAKGHVCASGAEVAQRSEFVIVMVPDTPDVEQPCCSARTASRRGSPRARSWST